MLIAFIWVVTHFVAAQEDFEKTWHDYKLQFNKNYFHKDSSAAQYYLQQRIKENNIHNIRFAAGEYNYTVSLNQFSDSDLAETLATLCRTFYVPEITRGLPLIDLASLLPGPLSLDLTALLQPIVNQGRCGSCWAYSAVAQLESFYRQTSNVYSYKFSPQYLVDCSRAPPNSGCSGGWPRVAMEFILATGMPQSYQYPTTNVQGTCSSPVSPLLTPSLGNVAMQYNLNGNEAALKNLVANYGPIVITMKATTNFMTYRSGVFSDSLTNCPANCNNVNHAMVVVGYGTEPLTGTPYWIIRNSWGPLWGEAGYVRMLRDGSNNCNVACYAMFITTV